tara:strand:- start:39 stop:1154 length:1116 start_codon:yes stop_codon:yes gene_type:complete
MTLFQKLLFNTAIALPCFCWGEVIFIKAEDKDLNPTLVHRMSESIRIGNYRFGEKIPNKIALFKDPSEIKTLLDLQKAWINWAKVQQVDVVIREESANNFLKRIIWEAQSIGNKGDSTPLFIDHLMSPWSDESSQKDSYDYGESGVIYGFNRLKATEDEYAGKFIVNPFESFTSETNYFDERFFEDDWHPFWKLMKSKALEKGYKTLDGYCLDVYTKYCLDKYGQPFYFHMTPKGSSRHSQFYRRTAWREFTENQNTLATRFVSSRNSPEMRVSDWTHDWEYIMFTVKWNLVFEVWKDETFTSSIRSGRHKDLVYFKKNGWPFRVSFQYKGSVIGLIDHTIKLYNGKDAKCYIGARMNGFRKSEPQIFLRL